ncbi:MAG: FHA domain-containing protein [Magnetococcus sp. DMHC-1]
MNDSSTAETVSVVMLRVLNGSTAGTEMVLSPGTQMAGRDVTAQLRLHGKGTSRKHFRVRLDASGTYLENVSQTNPVLVNDVLVQEGRLFHGDRVTAGVCRMVFLSNRAVDASDPDATVINATRITPSQPVSDTDLESEDTVINPAGILAACRDLTDEEITLERDRDHPDPVLSDQGVSNTGTSGSKISSNGISNTGISGSTVSSQEISSSGMSVSDPPVQGAPVSNLPVAGIPVQTASDPETSDPDMSDSDPDAVTFPNVHGSSRPDIFDPSVNPETSDPDMSDSDPDAVTFPNVHGSSRPEFSVSSVPSPPPARTETMPSLRTASTPVSATGSRAASDPSPAMDFVRLTDVETGRVYPVDQDPCLIGRSPDVSVVLDNPYVSRKHAKIQRTREGGHLIEGLNPDSPIKINDVDVKTQRLFHGDRIGIDIVTLLFESDRPEDARPVAASDQTLYRPKPDVPSDQTLYRPKTVAEAAPISSGNHKADTPGGGKTNSPGGGKTDSPGGGKTNSPGGGKTDSPGIGKTNSLGGGKTDSPGGGNMDADGDRTILEINRPAAPIAGPRLVWHRLPAQGGDLVMAIKHPRVVVGRKPPSDLCIDDPSVSRQHLILIQKETGFQAQTAADSIRILINEKSVAEGRVCNGDRLQLGASRLTFLSDRPEDQQPTAAKNPGSGATPRSNLPVILLIVVSLLGAGGYLGHERLFVPYQMQEHLDKAKKLVVQGNYDATLETLQPLLLSTTTGPALQKRARELLAQSAKIQAETMLKAETPEPAKEVLRKHLRQYGSGVESDSLWEILDQIHFTLGQKQEKTEQKERAVREYLAVRPESPLFPQAQEAISQIWLAQQKSRMAPADKNRTLEEKLRKADENFQKKRFLSPPEDNAFIDYKLILADDPNNTTATIRLQAMLAYYQEQGDQQATAKKYAAAMEEYQRCLVIDPNARDVREKIARIQVEQANQSAAPAKKEARSVATNEKKSKENKPKNNKGSTEPAEAANAGKEMQTDVGKEDVVRQERVRKMLQESGVESNWVMDYLFKEDKEGSAKTGGEETPWKE